MTTQGLRGGFAELISAHYERYGLSVAPKSGSGSAAALAAFLGLRSELRVRDGRLAPPLDWDPLVSEQERMLKKLRLCLSPGEPAQVGLRDRGLLRKTPGKDGLVLLGKEQSEGLGTAVVCHEPQDMLGGIQCQLAFARPRLVRRHSHCEPRTMARSRGTGKPDPLQARALSRLNEIIDERGFSQIEIADRSGLSQGHISKVLNGENPEAAFYVIAKIAKAIDVSLDWITEEPRKAKSVPPPATGTDPRR